MTCTPAGRPDGSSSLPVSSNGKLKMGYRQSRRWCVGLVPSCPIRRPKRQSKLPFLFRLQLHVILFFPTWESCGGRFCPMSGDRAAHEVTQQYYIGNHGATNAKGEGLDQVSEESQVEG